jgi:hypothetical protein
MSSEELTQEQVQLVQSSRREVLPDRVQGRRSGAHFLGEEGRRRGAGMWSLRAS